MKKSYDGPTIEVVSCTAADVISCSSSLETTVYSIDEKYDNSFEDKF